MVNALSASPRKWSNTLKQFVGKLLMNCLCMFDNFVGLALKRLKKETKVTLRHLYMLLRLWYRNTESILFPMYPEAYSEPMRSLAKRDLLAKNPI